MAPGRKRHIEIGTALPHGVEVLRIRCLASHDAGRAWRARHGRIIVRGRLRVRLNVHDTDYGAGLVQVHPHGWLSSEIG